MLQGTLSIVIKRETHKKSKLEPTHTINTMNKPCRSTTCQLYIKNDLIVSLLTFYKSEKVLIFSKKKIFKLQFSHQTSFLRWHLNVKKHQVFRNKDSGLKRSV